MVTVNPTSPIITPSKSVQTRNRQVAPPSATAKRTTRQVVKERRMWSDRRSRRGSQQLMDRRLGLERRRSRIDLSV